LWIEPIDFRKGLDALIGLCRQNIGAPYDGYQTSITIAG
jgi:hypothetical protein